MMNNKHTAFAAEAVLILTGTVWVAAGVKERASEEAHGDEHDEDDEREHRHLPQRPLAPALPQHLPVHLRHAHAPDTVSASSMVPNLAACTTCKLPAMRAF